mgnify:CR=1 FL=1
MAGIKKVSDWAKWNIVNYQSAINAGIEAVILKVINAQNKPDDRFYEHVAGCNSVGLPVIAGYTYSYANTVDKAKKAADAFVEVGAPKGIDTMALDLEDKSMMGLGSKIVTIIDIYRGAARAAGMDFLIYTGAQYYNPCLKPYAREIAEMPIWWARYPLSKEFTPTTPTPDTKYLPTGIDLVGWQYTSKGVIPGGSGYVDLNVWYKDEPMQNTKYEITVRINPFTEPTVNVKIGKTDNDAMWVQWYLWRFGLMKKEEIDGIIGKKSDAGIREAQHRLGLVTDGIVGKTTRAVWKKVC